MVGQSVATHINSLSASIVEELTISTATSLKDNLETTVCDAPEINQKIKDEVLKVVKNASSQAFKKTYRVWNLVKDTPTRVMADLLKPLDDVAIDTTPCDELSECGSKCRATLLYAMLAISQNCLRCPKPGEVASVMHSAARECSAVKAAGADLPPKFAAILALA